MPLHGFTRMFERMLTRQNIMVLLNAEYREVRRMIPYRELIFTGPIDEFFDHQFGKLPYRSLEFKFMTRDLPVAQEGPVINYPNENAFTRATEFKYLTGQDHPKTTLVYEYPQAEGDRGAGPASTTTWTSASPRRLRITGRSSLRKR